MILNLLHYLLTIACFLVLDTIWLGHVASGVFKAEVGSMLLKNPNIMAAICFYLIFVAGLLYFVVYPESSNNNTMRHFLVGAFFGLVTYATFDLTTLALIKGWNLKVTLIDLGWGMFVCGTLSVVSIKLLKLLVK